MDQLRSIQSSWDENGDGKVSVEELRKAYDTNGDGKIDESELSTLADQLSDQLSVQTSYTNRLLSQLQQLEEQSLKHQQEAQARESTLRRTMEAMDQARADSNMLRSRLQNANDVIDQNRREEQDQMAGAHEKDRQVAALQKIVDQQAHDLDRANSEVMDTRSSLDRIRRSNAEAQNELEEQKRRFAEEQARFQVAAEETLRERRLLESKLSPLAQENIGLQETLQKQTDKYQTTSSELQSTKAELNALQRRTAELEQTELALNSNLARAQETDRKRFSEMSTMERKLKDATETSLSYQKQYEEHRTECQRLSNEHVLMTDRVATTNAELEALQRDVQDLQSLRRAEKAESERQLSLAQEDLSRLADEARIRHTEYSEQLTSNTRDHQDQLHSRDEQYVQLQDDYRSLHELLQRVQLEQSEQASIFDVERKKYDSKVLEAQARLQSSENKSQEQHATLKLSHSQLEQDVTALQRELIARTENYVTNMSALSSAVNQVRGSAETQRRRLADVHSDLSDLNGATKLAKKTLSDPHEMHHDGMHRGTERLTSIITTLRGSMMEHRDCIKSTQLSLEEERTRTIMLDEERSRLAHDNEQIRERLEETKRTTTTRIDASRREANAVMTLRDDVERQLQKTMAQLNDANAQTRSLQEQHQQLQQNLRDEHAKHSSSMSDLEGHAHRLEIDWKQTQSERDGLQVEISQLRSELAGTSSDMQELQGRLATCEDQLQVTRTKTFSDQTKHKHQAASLSESMRKLQSQLEQTRSLLDTVQQQREMLKNDNQDLRSELDTMYKQRANGGL